MTCSHVNDVIDNWNGHVVDLSLEFKGDTKFQITFIGNMV